MVGEEAVFQTLGAPDFVAGIAIGELRRGDKNPPQLFLISQLFLATQEAVISGIEGRELVRSLKARQRLRHCGIGGVVVLKNILAELRAERRDIIRILLESLHDRGLVRHTHFDGVERRSTCLILQQRGAAVPELATHILSRRIPAERR